MSGNPGGTLRTWTPTPPERGSFPLDHEGECAELMARYLQCMKYARGDNSLNCRMLAKEYLGCRMDNGLMERVGWELLGFGPAGNGTSQPPPAPAP